MSQPLALIVDDEPDIRQLMQLTLQRMSIDCVCAADLQQARALLDQRRIAFCLTDMRLPDGNGLSLVSLINARFPQTPVAVFTAHGNMEAAVEAMRQGAFDFVSKPVDLKVLRGLVTRALESSQLAAEPEQELLGCSPQMEHIRQTIRKLSRSQAPVYISGESGTGKELAARAIHQASPRCDNEFVAVNCGAIPQELMESEFFGHRKGSFTGAHQDKPGLFQFAEGGTLFLDEIGDIPISMQVKLLRSIQEKSIRPVGSAKEQPVDVRIISATHKDLGQLVQSGQFRQDLYYRINVIPLHIPPLRERPKDIPLLVEHVLGRIHQNAGGNPPRLHAKALSELQRYAFPGNVRELENILERACALCDGNEIGCADLNLTASEPLLAERPRRHSGRGDQPLEEYLEDLEKQAILDALEQTRWNRTEAARLLGLSFRSMRYRLAKLKLDQD
jgi:two-component system response regulator PilR (NtrC family)